MHTWYFDRGIPLANTQLLDTQSHNVSQGIGKRFMIMDQDDIDFCCCRCDCRSTVVRCLRKKWYIQHSPISSTYD